MSRWWILFFTLNVNGIFLTSSASISESFSDTFYNLCYLAPDFLNFLIKDFIYSQGELPDTNVKDSAEFDFIVVGAGSAGAIVAARLSETNSTVLLIEAGGPENLIYDIPGSGVFSDALYLEWGLRSHPSDKYCRGMREKRCALLRGRVMGGSTTVGLAAAMRGGPADYDAWQAMGNFGWGYKDVLKYFKKMERVSNTNNANKTFDLEYRGTEGPVSVEYSTYHSPVAEAFVQAGVESGFEEIDYNGRQHIGFSIMQSNVEDGERVSTNRAYLRPARDRKNLILTRHSFVMKVLMDKKSMRATGVTYIKNGKIYKALARKEVILSAGGLQSPQLLMVSGLGPADHLKEMKIDLVKDIPGVGQQLIDHVQLYNLNFVINTTDTFQTNNALKLWKDRTAAEYFHEKKGFLAGTSVIQALAYVNIDDLQAREGLTNTEITYIDFSPFFNDPILWRLLGVDPKTRNKSFKKYANRYAFTLVPVLTKPESRGRLRLKSSDPRDKPIIIPNYFDEPNDLKRMIKAIKFAIKLSQTQALRKYNATLVDTPVWGCHNLTHMSDEYWECVCRTLTFSYWHFGGTAIMGPKSDQNSVVDERLKVHGIKGLRVIDGSIIPLMPSAHNNFPIMMIGEKGADMIKEDWGYFSPTTNPQPSVAEKPVGENETDSTDSTSTPTLQSSGEM